MMFSLKDLSLNFYNSAMIEYPSDGEEYTCECGIVWIIREHQTIMRDIDSLNCECGNLITKWNGAVFYSAKKKVQP
jgi:hypothetical protein